ncbi:MAG: PP2C family protein-serine/threonine phosphatase [Opitutales bacterium]
MSESSLLRLHAFGLTDRGLVRRQNEDSLLLDDAARLYAVADGLGGLPEGAVASELATESLKDFQQEHAWESFPDFRAMFQFINERVVKRGQTINSELGIGTTLTAVHFLDDTLRIGHIGDTGVLLLRGGELSKLTRDHTMAQEMLDRMGPEDDPYIPEYYTHTLTRCIGQEGTLQVDVETVSVQPDDRLLLFSDGVTKTHEFEEIRVLMADESDPEAFVRTIVNNSNERGGPDNVTAIAIYLE